MTERNPTVVVTSDETLPDVIDRVRGAASGGRTVHLVVPIDSALLLTANEFRTLKSALDDQRLSVVMRTVDPLRLQLGERLGVPVQTLPRAKPKAVVSTLPPPLPEVAEPPARSDEVGDTSTVRNRFARPDPTSHWPLQNGAQDGAHEAAPEVEPELVATPPASPVNPPRRWLPVAALLVVLVIATFFAIRFVVPRAVVHIVPKTSAIEATLTFDVTKDGRPLEGEAAFALKPESRTFDVVWEGSAPATGVRLEPDAVATGTVELRNASGEAVTVDAGTVITTETGTEFSFVDAVSVPPADPASGEPGAASGKATAVDAGSTGNVGNGELGGRLENGVYYSNRLEPTSGGTDKAFPVVAQADLDALSAKATDAADELAAKAIAEAEQGGEVTLSSISVAKQQNAFNHKVNEDADAVSLRSTLTVEALAYDRSAAEAKFKQALTSKMAGDTPPGYIIDPQQITFVTPVEIENVDSGARLQVVAHVNAVADLDDQELQALADRLVGATDEEAAAILAESPDIAQYSIEYQPSWLPQQMPTYTDRIQFELAGQ